MVTALLLLCLALATALGGLAVYAVTLRRQVAEQQERLAQVEADLAAALKPPPPSTTVERYARRMLRTAERVRTEGLTGLVQGAIEDIAQWAGTEERAEIVHMAASDGTVTLFFSDIEDSTALNDRLGDDTWVRVLNAHDRVLRARIDKYRGQVVKTAGDGFMVAFRDPEAACRAAVKVQRDLERSTDAALRRHGPVRVRIGIHCGQVVAKEGDYFGRNVAMAARVADLAAGGEVLASDAVRDALDEDAAVVLDGGDEVPLKGLTGTHRVWRVRPARTRGNRSAV
ncbi:adenylate/guanylate cyclase domain-containing protein [Nocardioides panacisoli]|uniref:adenylate/guanylate cyclase domain-containing protein n=1 Tax=Nocardioides panacisoli TaxID=627624 RepID=UPI001C630497|nr:adenylate/guanylate cyclase domain-containing protein [Nocardioides panacisoli]QYJ04127.1 adenylate/guanylate cyclase domain-containing protein [Nocardioides panacisoli]